ncbi:MAG: hypothetical protein ACXADY_07610 [Candidatus Hodarchaeales archaeon]|jgi:hypothetical protein
MSKDKIYGYGIFFLTIIFLFLYTLYVPIQKYFGSIVGGVEGPLFNLINSNNGTLNPFHVTVTDGLLWPVFLATLMIGLIIAWIGITMATTPPPEPIDLDDLNLDDEEFEEEEKED